MQNDLKIKDCFCLLFFNQVKVVFMTGFSQVVKIRRKLLLLLCSYYFSALYAFSAHSKTNVVSLWCCHSVWQQEEGECAGVSFALSGDISFTRRFIFLVAHTAVCQREFSGDPEERDEFWGLSGLRLSM